MSVPKFDPRRDSAADYFDMFFALWGNMPLPPTDCDDLARWCLDGLTYDELRAATQTALDKRDILDEQRFNYLRGVVRNIGARRGVTL